MSQKRKKTQPDAIPASADYAILDRRYEIREEIRRYCAEQVDTLWDEVKRFENPHRYYVDLSQKLWDERQRLLNELSVN